MKQFLLILMFTGATLSLAQTSKTLKNRALDQDLKLCVNDGGVEKCPVEIDGATGKFKGTDGLADDSNPGMVPSYDEQTIALDGNFSTGNIHIVRIGKLVTVTMKDWAFTGSISDAASTAIIPVGLRPNRSVSHIVANVASRSPFFVVQSTGIVRLQLYLDTNIGSFSADTSPPYDNYDATISYVID